MTSKHEDDDAGEDGSAAQPCAACGGTGQLAPAQVENPQTGTVSTVYPPCLECLACR